MRIDRDRLDLDACIARQASHLDRRARGRRISKVLGVGLIHRCEIVHVAQKDVRAHNIVERQFAASSTSSDSQAPASGRLDRIVDQLTRIGVGGNLSAQKDKSVRAHTGRIRTGSLRPFLGTGSFLSLLHCPLQPSSSRAIQHRRTRIDEGRGADFDRLAPAIRNSAASSPLAIPPIPITGIFTAAAASVTSRSASGLMAGPESPANPAAIRGLPLSHIEGIGNHRVDQRNPSAPASSAACANGSMRATFGESLTISGRRATRRTRVRSARASSAGSLEKNMPPSLVFGHDTFSS